jgi:hypothetical protein
MSRPWCNHYRGMHEKDKCEAGIEFASLENYGTRQFSKSCPCYGPGQGECERAEYPTAEEMAAHDAELAERFERVTRTRAAIVEYCGGPWKRGEPGKNGVIDCPACGNKDCLQFSRSSYNGHIHARCNTEDCVSWME